MAEQVVRVRSVTVVVDGATVLDDVSLDIERGEMVALVGHSGSGKTTLLNVLLGFVEPAAGDVDSSRPTARDGWAHCSFVPQALGLVPELTLFDNVAFPLLIARRRDDEAVAGALAALDLGHLRERAATEVSLGEQQRAAVARAIVSGDTLLVADEPTAHQDIARTRLVADALVAAAGGQRAVIVATHDELLASRCDRIVELDQGRLVAARSMMKES